VSRVRHAAASERATTHRAFESASRPACAASCVICRADRDPGDPVRMQVRLRQRLVHAGLIGAERTATPAAAAAARYIRTAHQRDEAASAPPATMRRCSPRLRRVMATEDRSHHGRRIGPMCAVLLIPAPGRMHRWACASLPGHRAAGAYHAENLGPVETGGTRRSPEKHCFASQLPGCGFTRSGRLGTLGRAESRSPNSREVAGNAVPQQLQRRHGRDDLIIQRAKAYSPALRPAMRPNTAPAIRPALPG